MARLSAAESLKESIRMLEFRQMEERDNFKKHFSLTYQSLNPINLLKNTLRDLGGSTELKNSFYETILPILTGFLTQRMMVRSKAGTFMKIIGAVLQYGLTSFVTKNSENIRLIVSSLIDKLVNPDTEEDDEEEKEEENDDIPEFTRI